MEGSILTVFFFVVVLLKLWNEVDNKGCQMFSFLFN